MATAASITERGPKKFEPRTIGFPEDVQTAIKDFLCKQIEGLLKRNEELHKRKIPEWRKIVDAQPREEEKSWPFPNCSNIVYPAVAEARDDLAARVLMLLWGTAPVANFSYFTKDKSQVARRNKQKATTLTNFIDYVAFEQEELNLYTKENLWFTTSAGLGKAYVAVAPEHRLEKVYAGYYPGQGKEPAVIEFDGEDGETTLYEGPKVINLRNEDILINDHEIPFEENDPIVRRCTLNRRQLRERGYRGHYLKEAVEKVETQPDRYGESENKQRENRKKGLTANYEMAEWDIYECYFSWWHNGQKFRLIAWVHFKTKTTMNCVYNFVPRNQVPIVETRLSVNGMGFAEMLKSFQEEISTAKNQRADAISYGILGVNTVELQQSTTIDRNFTITPGMFIPARKDSFQHFEMANAAIGGLSLQNEELLVQQLKSRAGIDPAIRAQGAGAVGKKGYSSMGTLSLMQDGNSRNDHRTSDFRHSHIRLISLDVDFYGMLGLGRKAKLAGESEALLNEAFKDHADRILRCSMRAANASMNREVTKQNLIILNQSISQYIKETSSQIQAIMNSQTPGGYKKWMYSMIIAKTLLTQETIRQFQISEQPQEFVPDIEEFLQEYMKDAQPPQGSQPSGAGPVPVGAMAELIRRRSQGGGGPVVPGVPSIPGGPPVSGQ